MLHSTYRISSFSFRTIMYCNLWPYVLWPMDYRILKRIVSMEIIRRNMVTNLTSNFKIILSFLVYCASLGCPWAYMWLIPPGLLEIASMVSKQCWIYRLGIFTLHIGVKLCLNYSLDHFRSYQFMYLIKV